MKWSARQVDLGKRDLLHARLADRLQAARTACPSPRMVPAFPAARPAGQAHHTEVLVDLQEAERLLLLFRRRFLLFGRPTLQTASGGTSRATRP